MVMGVNIAVTMLSTPFDSYIVAHERFVFQQSRQLFTALAQPFLAVLLLWLGMGAVGVACAQLTVSAILLAWNIAFATRRLGMRFSFRGFGMVAVQSGRGVQLLDLPEPDLRSGQQQRAQLPAGRDGQLDGGCGVRHRGADQNIFFSMSTTMSNVFTPQINRIVAETDDNMVLTRLMTRVGRYQMVIFWYLFGGFIVLGRFFVRLWAGEANSDAYWLCLIMVLPVMIPLTQNTGIEIQRAKNRHKVRSLIYILTSAIDIVVSVLLIPSCGYWATAIGYVASIVLGTGLFMNWYYHTRIGLDMVYFWKHQLPTIGLALVTVVVCLLGGLVLPVGSIPVFLLWGMVYTMIFGFGVMKVSLTTEERGK